jgi:hypothetical protein
MDLAIALTEGVGVLMRTCWRFSTSCWGGLQSGKGSKVYEPDLNQSFFIVFTSGKHANVKQLHCREGM